MLVEIVLRTCDRTNVHNDWRVRYHGIKKPDLIRGCTNSLIRSIKQSGIDVKLSILDDNSSEETVDFLQSTLAESDIDGLVIPLDRVGYNNSAYQQWKMCRDSKADLFYSVEDDYLHCPTAIKEMVQSYDIFVDRLKKDDVVIYPFDEPSEYNPPARSDFIVHGSHRHWRTGIFTTHVMMAKPKILQQNWELFETLALKYNGDYLNPRVEHYEESNTIWKLWTEGRYIRFNPIPSLALHMQFEQQKDPFINWQEWWKNYT